MRPPRDQLQGVLELEEDAVAAAWTVVMIASHGDRPRLMMRSRW
jgi:hypothetical protein